MTGRHVVTAALLALSACGTVQVEVTPRHPSPYPLSPRVVEDLKTYQARPPGGVAVYALEASGEAEGDVEAAVRKKAASLGCDGIMFTVREDQSTSADVALTGQLNAAREYVGAHIDALCMVDPNAMPAGCPGATPPDAAEAAVRGVLEQWRRAYESRDSDALARLYAHYAGVAVAENGAMLSGWTAIEPVLRDRLGRATEIRIRIDDVKVRAVGATAAVIATMLRERSDGATTATERGVLMLLLRAPAAAGDAGWVIVAQHYSSRRA